jgi:hypothetical protein
VPGRLFTTNSTGKAPLKCPLPMSARGKRRKSQYQPSSSKRPQTGCSAYEEEEVPDKGECMDVCLGESRSMCIVLCGHFGLCPSCGDKGAFAGKKRPYSDCPI